MIVLDASAIVDVVLDQPSAPWVLEQIAGAELCAPSHLLAEVLSAVARLVRAGEIDVLVARDAVAEAAQLDVEPVAPTRSHLVRALALQDRVRVLDALYVAVAEERGCAVVTTDERLARAGLECEVRSPSGSARAV